MKYFLSVIFIISCTVLQAQVTDFDTTNFARADSIAAVYSGYDLKDPERLAQLLAKDLNTDVEKFRVIFRWVCNNISYDIENYHEFNKKNEKFRYNKKKLLKWREKFNSKLYKKVIEDKLALCSGYSSLLEVMANTVGLQCETIDGYGRNYTSKVGQWKSNHAWNAVRLGTKWYLADVTWASGYTNLQVTNFTRRFNDDYFLTEPFYFLAEHYPEKESWTLLYNNPTLTEFKKSPIKSTGFIRYKVNQLYPTTGLLKVKTGSAVDFRFTSNHAKCPKEILVEVVGHKSSSNFKYSLEKNGQGELFFSHKFAKKGHYRVMIYLGIRLAFVYEATVT